VTAASVAIVGSAESERIGRVPERSALGLATEAARRALADCGLEPRDVDGVAAASLQPYLPTWVAHALGIEPRWVDATMMGGCSFLMHVRHACAAINAGHCEVALVVHGESGRSRVGAPGYRPTADSLQGQFELPFGTAGPMTLLTLGVLRYMKETGLTREQLAHVVVAQRTWAARNPRALRRDPIDVDAVLAAPPVAYPLTRPMCCVVTDAGGALVLTSAERARDLPRPPVYVLGTGEATETPMASQMQDPTSSRAFRSAGRDAFAEAGLRPSDIDHLMLYDAVANLPLYALEDLGFVERGEAGAFVAEGHTAPGGRLPMNTNGGGLCYTHTGMYGIFALQESVRQLRGEAPAQVTGIRRSLAHGIGSMFQAAATVILSNEHPQR
jgi:acetyl-CoA acetyltransferase